MAFGFKPDGSFLSQLPGATNIAQGIATQITNLTTSAQATTNLSAGSLGDSLGGFSNLVKTFSLEKPVGGPPYVNLLEQFASYAPLWTMAALSPNQFNNPGLYRGRPAALTNVVFSSAGRFDGQRVQTKYGAPEYYINNFEFLTTAGASPAVGNSNVQTISFDLFEPYSMGLFLQSAQIAAINAGYPTYNDCPFVLKLEFKGYTQDGAILSSNELLTKYFVVQLNTVDFNVTESGSAYKIKCHPYNHAGYSNVVNILPNEVAMKIDGNPGEGSDTLAYLLSKGTNSLCAALNKIQKNLVDTNQQDLADVYNIVFPIDWSDTVGLATAEASDDGGTLTFISAAVSALNLAPATSSTETGDGAIGQASLGFESTSGGNYNFGLAAYVVDSATGTIKRDSLTIDPKQRTFSFEAQTPITQIISQMVLSSEYAKRAIDSENLDAAGMINWFRLDVQIQIGEFDAKRGQRQRTYIYRVMPYLVHNSVFSNATAAPPGYAELKKVLAKEYNYIFTGQNNDIIKFDININSLFHNMKTITPPSQNDSVTNQDTNTPSEENPEDIDAESSGNANALAANGARPVKANPAASKDAVKGGYGAKDVAQIVATNMYNAIKDKGSTAGDLMKINLEILGDPYYMVDQGMANYLGQASSYDPRSQITSDQTMNYQGTDSFFNIVFRTPVEPNLGITGSDGSLYNFPDGGRESPFSGIYKVVKITNKFSDGVFKQNIEANRMPLQPNDFPDGYTPSRNPFIFSQPKQAPVRDSVSESASNTGIELRTPEEIDYSNGLDDFYG